MPDQIGCSRAYHRNITIIEVESLSDFPRETDTQLLLRIRFAVIQPPPQPDFPASYPGNKKFNCRPALSAWFFLRNPLPLPAAGFLP